jgi:hypothetical protein
LVEHILKKSKQQLSTLDRSKNLTHYANDFKHLQTLFENAISVITYETSIIMNLFELNLVYFAIIDQKYHTIFTTNRDPIDINYSYNQLIANFKDWLNNAFISNSYTNFVEGFKCLRPMRTKGSKQQQNENESYGNEQRKKPQSTFSTIKSLGMNIINKFSPGQETSDSTSSEDAKTSSNEETVPLNEGDVYSHIFSSFCFPQNYTDKFKKTVLTMLDSRLIDSRDLKSVLHTRIEYDFSILNKDCGKQLQDVFDAVIIKYLENVPSSIETICTSLKAKNMTLLKSYVSKYLENRRVDPKDILKYSIENSIFFVLLNQHFVFLSEKLESPIEKTDFERFFGTAIDKILDSILQIIRGSEKIKIIKLFKRNEPNVNHLLRLLVLNSNLMSYQVLKEPEYKEYFANFSKIIAIRDSEIEHFSNRTQSLIDFIKICKKFKEVDFKIYDNKLSNLNQTGQDNFQLNSLCTVFDLQSIKKATYDLNKLSVPIVTYFDYLDNSQYEKIKRINSIDRLKCVIFDSYMEDAYNEFIQLQVSLKLDKTTLIDILNSVVPKTFEKWQQLAKRIESSQIKLIEIDNLVSSLFDNKYSKFLEEISYIIEVKLKISNSLDRKNQLRLYEQFKSTTKAADLINTIHHKLQLTKEFTELNGLMIINSTEFSEWSLNKMDKNVEQTVKALNIVNTPEKLHCLHVYMNAMDLITWLRKNVKNLQEFKFLVDLLSTTSTGDYSKKNNLFAKVFKEAGTAFAPLIFDLKLDDDFSKFTELCKIVWMNLANDSKIADKLASVQDKVEMLEGVKNKKGKTYLFYFRDKN